ncbi:MAG: hypothetical protein QHH18_01705 [Candidatus Bathyarchaeota archaeon]|jgi:DNA replication factor GINS|nr:DNA replication complex GINS family protein [Candidatus Bathyarchaeota archaeon A05DMB-5]MDH7557308.1 hypothetical protein [Candidatus Bathyarchaeota archaeon]
MYNELYEIWKKELETGELSKLPRDFYVKITDYMRKLREESRMLDKKTARAKLLDKEMQNVKRMICEVVHARYRKLVNKIARGGKVPSDLLTVEEESFLSGALPFAEAFQKFADGILRGHMSRTSLGKEHKRTVLRFLKDVPAVIGADMKLYGPFKIEDVASLPVENAKILVKQGLAEKVEVN